MVIKSPRNYQDITIVAQASCKHSFTANAMLMFIEFPKPKGAKSVGYGGVIPKPLTTLRHVHAELKENFEGLKLDR